jgi:hypothetical protein
MSAWTEDLRTRPLHEEGTRYEELPVRLWRTRHGQVWVAVNRCGCGQVHKFAAGEPGDEPLFFLGPRVAPCRNGVTWVLRESPDPPRPLRLPTLRGYEKLIGRGRP